MRNTQGFPPDPVFGKNLVRPAGVGSLEVRFAYPVRLSPATHSQGHALFAVTWFFFCDPF